MSLSFTCCHLHIFVAIIIIVVVLLFAGTFGQPDKWDIYRESTFQHPRVPYDVLVDPLSLPDHPIISGKPDTHEQEDTQKKSEDAEVRAVIIVLQ